jgi:divinyl chlorophyllide a 8-vinyl-reductase
MAAADDPKRVLLFGASGTIGQAVAQELARAGHAATCVVRSDPGEGAFAGCVVHVADVTVGGLEDAFAEAFANTGFDAVISCLASRSGTAEDARKVDYAANKGVLDAARRHGVRHMILLSAICVQRPLLAFQHAKLAFEQELRESGLVWTIVRPTAFFKSLSGQVARVAAGKPFLLFGDGELTRCKPISDGDISSGA